jgi:RNA polymerase sigma-70 factor (ECF subfamily)
MTPTPVVALNRAVAIAMADGPERGLPLVDALADEIDGYHLFHAARADLLRRLDRRAEAAAAYGRALALATNATERAYLERRLAELGD